MRFWYPDFLALIFLVIAISDPHGPASEVKTLQLVYLLFSSLYQCKISQRNIPCTRLPGPPPGLRVR